MMESKKSRLAMVQATQGIAGTTNVLTLPVVGSISPDMSSLMRHLFRLMIQLLAVILWKKYLPPSFVRKVQNVIGQPSYLEDSSGQQWPITISILNGYMAIQEGWHKFALDHLLEVGDFLTFFYIKGSHFVVQIYGKSGCERLKFKHQRGRPRKRSSEEEEEIVVLDEPIRPLNINSGGKPGSSAPVESESEFQHGQSIPKARTASNSCSDFGKRQSFPTTISKDESVLMFNTNARYNYNQGEDRTYLHDLSSFEMGRNEFNPDKAKQSSLGGEMIPIHSQIRNETESTDNAIQIAKNGEYHISGHYNDVLFGAFPTKSAENSKMSKGMPNVLSDYPTAKRNNAVLGNARGFSSENETLSLGSCKITGSKYTAIPKYSGCSVSIPTVKFSSGGETVAVKKERVKMGDVAFGLHQTSTGGQTVRVKKEPVEMGEVDFGCHKKLSGKEQNIGIKCAPMPFRAVRNVSSIVKTKPDMQSALVPCVAANPILVEVKCQSYVELPTSLPPFEGRNKGGNSQLIFLRDSVGRLWPVLCTEILDVTALVDGWQRFCQENNIQPGDLCKFKCENSVQCIYGVDISANQLAKLNF